MRSNRKAGPLLLGLGFLGFALAGFGPRPSDREPRPLLAISGHLPNPEPQAEGPTQPPDLARTAASTEPLERLEDPRARAFLERVLARAPACGEGVEGYQFQSWSQEGHPTREGLGLKAIPGVDVAEVVARIMDVDGYRENLAHVVDCRPLGDGKPRQPDRVRFHQVLGVPGVARIQQDLEMIDAGTIRGYRVVTWRLLEDETETLDPRDGARSASNVGAWLVAPGVLGNAISSWPRREDVNFLQWKALTGGADRMAKSVVEGNLDGMAEWSRKSRSLSRGD